MARPGLYANIHAKRKRGGKMRKKGAKGAPFKHLILNEQNKQRENNDKTLS